MSQDSSRQDGDSGRPKGPSTGDVIKQTMLSAATFVVVSAIAGPAVGAVAAAVVGGSGGDGGSIS